MKVQTLITTNSKCAAFNIAQSLLAVLLSCVSLPLLWGGQVLEKCCSESAAGRKQDTRITGSSAIDQQLQKVRTYVCLIL